MTQPMLMTLASAAEHPLIDIDNTAFVQFAIFVVMALASNHLLFKPYLRMREQRDAGMDGARDKAKALSAEADAKLAATPVITTPTVASPSAPRTVGIAIITKTNSLPCASKKPSCTEPGVDHPKTRAAAATRIALIVTSATRNINISNQLVSSIRQSSDMPTVMKKKPSSRFRNGFASVCIRCR